MSEHLPMEPETSEVQKTQPFHKRAGKRITKGMKDIAAIQLPTSLNWIYSFGFKVGMFLALKSFLTVRYTQLSRTGGLMVLTQLFLGAMLIVLGICMQSERIQAFPAKLQKISHWYGYTFLFSAIICALRAMFSWQFFRNPDAQNWFVDFFSNIGKGASEITLSIIFWDFDLWTAFCGLLFLLSALYFKLESTESDVSEWTPVYLFKALAARVMALPHAFEKESKH